MNSNDERVRMRSEFIYFQQDMFMVLIKSEARLKVLRIFLIMISVNIQLLSGYKVHIFRNLFFQYIQSKDKNLFISFCKTR